MSGVLVHSDLSLVLTSILQQRVRPLKSVVARFRAGLSHGENVQPSPKLLLVSDGELNYTINDQPFCLTRGAMVYRPAHSVSHWQVGDRPCTAMWAEFSHEGVALPVVPLEVAESNLMREASVMVRLDRLIQCGDPLALLEAEAELKAALARFFRQAAPPAEHRPAPPAVQRVLQYVAEHFAEADVLERIPDVSGMSRSHFRLVFARTVGQSARSYVTLVRLRAARHHVRHTSLSLKEIARAVGYSDPLFFSRHYRQCWGCAPSDDRAT